MNTFLHAHLPLLTVTVGGVVSILLQMLKAKFPGIGGWRAIALNVAMNAAVMVGLAEPRARAQSGHPCPDRFRAP